MDDPKARVIHRYFEELFNQGKLELVAELLHPDYVNHAPGWPDLPRGRDGVRRVVESMRRALPDLHYRIDELVVGPDCVAARTTMTGTHQGELFGIPATSKRFEVRQMTFERFREGKIIAHHRLTDELSLLKQLGVVA